MVQSHLDAGEAVLTGKYIAIHLILRSKKNLKQSKFTHKGARKITNEAQSQKKGNNKDESRHK